MGKLAEKLAAAQKSSKTGASKPLESKPKAEAPAPAKKKRTDWEAVQRDYRTGQFTLRELEAKHGADNGLISRKAKKEGWTQDLSKAIKAATNAKLVEELVSKEISSSQQKVSTTVLAAAELNKEVILGHRRDIKALASVAAELTQELGQIGKVDLRAMAEMLQDDSLTQEQVAELREAVSNVVKLPMRSLVVQRLSSTYAKLQTLERQAYGLDDPEAPPPVDELADLSDEELEQRINERIKQSRA
jgi:hypothetical protein